MKRQLETSEQRTKLNSNESRLKVFLNWLDQHQAIYDNIDIRPSELYKGFALHSNSSEKLPNIQIPICLLMSSQAAKSSSTFVYPTLDVLEQIEDHIDRETFILVLFLLHERLKKDQSHWHPYIQMLPTKFSTALFHKENYLENTSAFYITQTMKQSMSEVYRIINTDEFTLEELMWAYTILSSRAFAIADFGTTLVPLADLANHVSFVHDVNLITAGIDKETQRFVVKTTDTKISNGDELCIKYNDFSNWQLLLYYGFAIENNPFDSILFELKLETDDSYEMETKKLIFINLNEDLCLEHELQIIENKSIVTDELLATLRLIVMTKEELDQYNLSNLDELFSTMVNIDNERRALNKLLKHLNELKEISFTQTLNENLERIQTNQLTDDEKYSLVYLIGQKKIIETACHWVENALVRL